MKFPNCEPFKGKQVDFRNVLSEVEKPFVESVYAGVLYDYPNFLAIYCNGDAYYEDFLEVLESQKFSEPQKHIALLAMQNLEKDRFIEYLEDCYQRFKEGYIGEALFSICLFPGEDFPETALEKYQNPKYQELLIKMENDLMFSEPFRDTLRKIRTGEVWKNVKRRRKLGS